jgi:hypothetical protein
MDYTTIYMLGFIFTVGAFAVRARDVDTRTLFVIALAWPISMAFTLLIVLLSLFKWDLDVAESPKLFGFRRPTNPKARGFAVTVFGTEIQFYGPRKTVDQ